MTLRLFGSLLWRLSLLFNLGTAMTLAATPSSKPIVYTIAGSDSGGGAGIQADLHAMHSLGCHGCSAITCLTAQNSVAVTAIHAPPTDFLHEQLRALQSDLPPMAVKIGMLGTKELAQAVGEGLKELPGQPWVVLDPVMISTSGHRLVEEDTQTTMIEEVFPMAHVLTPNKFEAEALIHRKLETVADVEQAAKEILEMGKSSAVLIKGGHGLQQGNQAYAQDYLLARATGQQGRSRLCDGELGLWIRSPRYDTEHTHGTGCTLSSSIASALALGQMERQSPARGGAFDAIQPVDACCLAKAYVTAGIAQGVQLGQGPGPVVHTCFPCEAQHYPSIVTDPDEVPEPFRSMVPQAKATEGTTPDSVLGLTLPIVDTVEWVEKLCQTPGVTDVQLRVKDETDAAKINELVQRAQTACAGANIKLWVNDHWEAAVEAGCYGVHLGQEDLYDCHKAGGLAILKAKNMALGVSTHSFGELSAALGVKPSYISLGPVFGTTSKKVGFQPQGLAVVSKWRQLIPADVPLVCIGGIGDAATAKKVCQAGADCVAVIGAVTKAPDPAAAISELNEAMKP